MLHSYCSTAQVHMLCSDIYGYNGVMKSPDHPPAFPLETLELVSATVLAKDLGIPRQSAESLMNAEVASALLETQQPTAFLNHLGRPVISGAGRNALRRHGEKLQTTDLKVLLPAVNVRVREARRVDEPDRGFMGWHPRLTEHEANLATSRWWPVPRHDVTGHTFLVTVSGFVVRCGRIEGHRVERGKIAYSVDWEVTQVNQILLHRRIDTPQGGTTVYL